MLCLAASLAAAPGGAAPPASGGVPDPRATLERARARQAVADFDEAADALELFARQSLKAPEAPEALRDAVSLRLGMGQTEQAGKDGELFVRTYGATMPAEAARVSFGVTADAASREDDAAARKRVAGWVATFDRRAPLDLRVRAHALLGRAYVALDQPKMAEAEYGVVRSLWLQAEGGDDQRTAAAPAVGEALFFFAEQKRRRAEAMGFPRYRGSVDSQADFLDYLHGEVAGWLKKKRPMIEEAERAYLEIQAIQPAAPTRWAIAARARVGGIWARFAAEMRAPAFPREFKPTARSAAREELRAFAQDALYEAGEPLRQRAKAAYAACVDESVRRMHADESSERCVAWLARNDGERFHAMDELPPRARSFGAAVPLPEPAPGP